jgi:flagellar basal-body rod protein FlgF
MSDTIAMIEAAMRADADAVRVIGQNIANAEVTAYRRQVPVQIAEFESIVDAATQVGQPTAEVAVDTRAGTLKTTGETLDFAIEGGGFFVLESASGPVYTRRGDFHVAANGVLTAASGNAVLGAGGPIQLGDAQPTIELDGSVRVGTDVLDRLQVVQFADEAKLEYLGNGLYANPHEMAVSEAAYPAVRQGSLETSNVQPVAELVRLMETMRHFETAQRLVRGYDQLMEKAISELGRTSR